MRVLAEVIGVPQHPDDEIIWVSVAAMRNFSRTSSTEFSAMRERLAQLLNSAGEPHRLRFTTDRELSTSYALAGTAYLINANGFDQWELYFSLKPAEAEWTMWRNDLPIRLLRQERVREQQLFVPRLRQQ